MTYDVQTIRDDLAFMRALASEGRRAPLLMGGSLLAAGLIYSAASMGAWGIATGIIPLPAAWQAGVWLAATAVYLPVLFAIIRVAKTKPGASALTNRAVSIGWSAVGWVLLVMFAACAVVTWRLHSPVAWSVFPSLVLSVYGAAWAMSAAMAGLSWIKWVAAGCFASAVGVAVVADRAEIFLVYAAALLLLAALPGWLLMRQEPPETV